MNAITDRRGNGVGLIGGAVEHGVSEALQAVLQAMSEAKLEVSVTYRREHSEGKLKEAKDKKCPLRSGGTKVVGWELQLVYKTTPSGPLAALARAGVLCALFDSRKEHDWTRDDGGHVIERFLEREAWPIGPGGASDPDPHWANRPYPEFCAVDTDMMMKVELAIVFNKNTRSGPGRQLEFERSRQVPSRRWYEGGGHSDVVPDNRDEFWRTTNDDHNQNHPNNESDWVVISAPKSMTQYDDEFQPYHCGVDTQNQDDINRGNIGNEPQFAGLGGSQASLTPGSAAGGSLLAIGEVDTGEALLRMRGAAVTSVSGAGGASLEERLSVD